MCPVPAVLQGTLASASSRNLAGLVLSAWTAAVWRATTSQEDPCLYCHHAKPTRYEVVMHCRKLGQQSPEFRSGVLSVKPGLLNACALYL